MFDAFVDWLKLTASPTRYTYSRGMWIDSLALADTWIAVVLATGGPGPDVDDRRQRFRVLLLGPRNGRQYADDIQVDMESLAAAALGDSAPCAAASVRAIGEPSGPGYTTENRAWVSLDFEVLF
ncbi:hypothetical protein [Bordetella sp. BOR01]|uniref:hypothetical protein n=1 Tax=Bordetella sp. BOR01 TaxID=2854779 RepID=UPI001C439043|nr:hypothetical protein [Bordetella sp. BOR01]MBV7482525.1 hypothetical protein [Bordetella sp. BOR01]